MSKYSVKKPFTVLVVVILVIILGVISFTSMKTDLLPSMDLPYIVVITSYPGASPEKIETVVTKPLEQMLATTSNIKEYSSISSENASIVILQFEEGINMDSVLIELNNEIDMLKQAWTDDKIGSPMIMKLNPDMLPITISAFHVSDMERAEITTFFNENILPELEKVSGVASVSVSGLLEESVQVSLNQEKIDEINAKVLENIDKELSKVESGLNSAKGQIISGKNEISKQSAENNKQIIEGLSAITTGREEIVKAELELKNTEKTLTFMQTALKETANMLAKEKTKIEKELETAMKDPTGNAGQIKILKTSLEGTETLQKETNQKIAENQLNLNQILAGKNEVTYQKENLSNKEKELQIAQSTLNLELSKAYSTIEAKESELNQGIEEFESAREQAYKNASLDGILTQDMISNILMAENFSMPAGYINTSKGQMLVKVGDEFKSIEELKNLTLFSYEIEGLENVTLADVADIEFIDNSADILAKINGEDGIILSIQKQSTASTSEVTEKLKEAMEELENTYENVSFTSLMDQGVYIDMVIGSVLENLIYGGILAIIILYIFLRDIKPTFIVAISIPISLLAAIALMYFTGVSINIISLSGLALGVGMLVDNSIVSIENIYRLRKEGLPAKEAAIQGTKEIAGAIISSTLTTVCVFVPIIFIEGITRQLFQDMGLTIAYSLLASLIVALTVVPAMSATVFENLKEKKHGVLDKISGAYTRSLNFVLKYKWVVLSVVVILFVVSGAIVINRGAVFIPPMEENQMSLVASFPKDATFDDSKQMADTITEKLLNIEDVEQIGVIQSSGLGVLTGGSDSGNDLSFYLILKEKKELSNKEIEKIIYEETKDLDCEIEVSTSNMDLSALGASGIEVQIRGDNLETLQTVSKEIAEIMQEVEGVKEVEDGIAETSSEKRIVVDKNKAMKNGVTVASVYSKIASELVEEKTATTINIENKDYPVIVAKAEAKVVTEDNLESIIIDGKSATGEVQEIQLSEIATIEDSKSLNSISRENGVRYISVTGKVDSDYNVTLVTRDLEEKLENYEAPKGITIEVLGESEIINNAMTDLIKMILLAVVFIYLIMVAQFQSLKAPFIMLFTIPLAFTGGFIALILTGTEISIIAMLGFLMLAGIIVNNGIVLIEYIIQIREKGMEKKEAIIEAGKTRLRPILMTALTTILGLSTMALGVGMGADMIQPLGIVTIGGLVYGTTLTLYVIPCLYDIFFKDKKDKTKKILTKS